MATSESIDDIVQDAGAARRNLSDLEHGLRSEIDDIKFRVVRERRPPNAEEVKRRDELRASLAEVRDAQQELGLVTVSRLNDSHEVAALLVRMNEINSGLKDDLDRLKRVAKLAQTVSKVADGVGKVVTKVAKLGLPGSPLA